MAKQLKRFFRRTLGLTLTAAVVFGTIALVGCRDKSDGSDHAFVVDLPANPRTLDPQTAVERYAQLILYNIFDGLMRAEPDGSIIGGVAREYTVSEDGLTYRFYLREDVFWSDSRGFHAQNTAHDFVFGFRRLFNPAVRSLNSSDYFAIANARAVREGNLPSERLGVVAEDDFTLVITLEAPEPDFLALLTRPPAFPANEEFFTQSAGRYGLITAASPVASNGAFILRDWVYDPWWRYENRIILRRNEANNNNSQLGRIRPRGVDFRMDRGIASDIFNAGDADCIIMSGAGIDRLINAGFPHTSSENSVWGVVFNENSVFSSRDLRRALALSADVDSLGIELTGYRAASGFHEHDPAAAAQAFRGSASLLAASHPVLIVPTLGENDAILSYVRSIVQQWQRHLGFFPLIEPLPYDEFARRFADGDFDLAVTNVLMTEFEPQPLSTAADDFIPFAFMSEYFFAQHGVEGVVYNPINGAIVFREGLLR
jgi:oligopeptide transport system substrate-binding protein